MAVAHEVQPTIADFSTSPGQLDLMLQINLDAFLAQVNLDGLQDTDNAKNAAGYNRLRAMPADQLAIQAQALLDQWNTDGLISIDEFNIRLTQTSLNIPENVPDALPRIAEWHLAGGLPPANIGRTQDFSIHWPKGAGTLVLRQQDVRNAFTGVVQGGASSPAISVTGGDHVTGLGAFAMFIPVGFQHILPKGLDHILFVLGLFFLAAAWRPLIWQTTAFTVAHTITLALGALDLVTIPPSIVEPLIAASVTFIAIENVLTKGLNPWRPLIIFCFGLLHGLGFASVLQEFGMPQGQFVPALIGFNIGVEVGQLTVIFVTFLAVWLATVAARGKADALVTRWFYIVLAIGAAALALAPYVPLQRSLGGEFALFSWAMAALFTACALSTLAIRNVGPAAYRRCVSIPASIVIGVVGAYWFVERVFY